MLLLVLQAPLQPLGGDPAHLLRHLGEGQLPDGQHLQAVVPHHAHIELPPVDELLHQGVGLGALVDELHALLQLLVALHDRGLGDADGGVEGQRLHEEGEAHAAGPADAAAAREDHEAGDGDAVPLLIELRVGVVRVRIGREEAQGRVGEIAQVRIGHHRAAQHRRGVLAGKSQAALPAQ